MSGHFKINHAQQAPDISTRRKHLFSLLVCPTCRASLTTDDAGANDYLNCKGCVIRYPVRNGTPILLPSGMRVDEVKPDQALTAEQAADLVNDAVSRHPYGPNAEAIIDQHRNGWVLDLGAGGKFRRIAHVVQVDIFQFPMVDVVASADSLPFADNSFDAVISQAVFEHLQYPDVVVEEIRRVLKPGGVVKIDTAFLQPEHGYPHHFYNATETGLRHWFRNFDIEWSGVEPYQHPKWVLHWYLSVYLHYLDQGAVDVLRQASLDQVLEALQDHSAEKHLSLVADQIIKALNTLPDPCQKIIAAGVSLRAINVPKIDSAATDLACGVTSRRALEIDRLVQHKSELAHQRLQEATVARKYADHLQSKFDDVYWQCDVSMAQAESAVLALDMRGYVSKLADIAPILRRRLARLLRRHLPQPLWLRLQSYRHVLPHSGTPPRSFLTFILEPEHASSLLVTFFSLLRQTRGDWELLVLHTYGKNDALSSTLKDLSRLDTRIHVFDSAETQTDTRWECALQQAKGTFTLRLPKACTLAFSAVAELFNIAENAPTANRISFDYARSGPESMRCYADTRGLYDDSPGVAVSRNSYQAEANAGCSRATHVTLSVHRNPGPAQVESTAHVQRVLLHLYV